MTATRVGYGRVLGWVKPLLQDTHTTVITVVAWAVLSLLVAQRVTPAALARALPAGEAGSGRSCLRRVRRWWSGPPLDQTVVSPRLIAQALALLPGHEVLVALDTTRLGPWEVRLAGMVVRGRTVPIGWAVCPYPWPKGRFRATTLALIQRLQAAFPTGVRWQLVADRGFPSAALFAQLRQGGTGWSVRLRLSDWMTVAGVHAPVVQHLAAGRLRVGQRIPASIGRGTPALPLVPAWVVVNDVPAALPKHKRNPGTARERARRATAHAQHQAHKRGRATKPPSAAAQHYAQTWVLFTAATVQQAVTAYAGRMSIEATYRDWHTGWGVRAAAALPSAAMVERLIGVVCVTYLLQMQLGQRLSSDPVGQRRRAQWTVTGRVSWFWCGQHLFQDPGYDWSTWLDRQWDTFRTLPPADHPTPVSPPAVALAARGKGGHSPGRTPPSGQVTVAAKGRDDAPRDVDRRHAASGLDVPAHARVGQQIIIAGAKAAGSPCSVSAGLPVSSTTHPGPPDRRVRTRPVARARRTPPGRACLRRRTVRERRRRRARAGRATRR
jgi:hypothetical protein